jgi:hypothetical protein
VLKFDGDSVGTWTPHVAQSFSMHVDLNAHTVTLTINGANPVTRPFVEGATNFNRFAWENSDHDSGKTAFDNIRVCRCVDGPTGPVCGL